MKLRNKLLILGLAAILMFPCTAMAAEDTSGSAQAPAAAAGTEIVEKKVYETQDGVLRMAAPTDNDKWAVVQDDNHWFTMSDGTDIISVDHYANGDTIPAPEFAGNTFIQICQAYFSTENEIFVITGKVTVAGDMPYVRDAMNSFEVLKYDTKTKKSAQAVYDLNAIGATMYCIATDGVHARANCSTDSAVIGEIAYGEAVYVNGEVTKDGAGIGWYEIQYDGGVAYVWKEWFDVNQPAADPVKTGDTMTVYSYDGSMTRQIYFYTDGVWRDDNGITYSTGMSAELDASDGTVWYESPMTPAQTGDVKTIYSADGSLTKDIYLYTDGIWRDDAGITYTGGMSAEIDGSDGSVWYESPMEPVPTGEPKTIYSYDGSMTRQIYFYTDGVWRDDNGITYSTGMSAELDASDGTVWYESPMEE